MALIDEIRHRARIALWPIVGAILLAYFSYHMVQGEQGVLAMLQLRAKVQQAEAIQAKIHEDRLLLEHRVALLRPDNLDPDMLEERARVMLNFARPDEVVILDDGASRNIR